jgi:hypothetical protein
MHVRVRYPLQLDSMDPAFIFVLLRTMQYARFNIGRMMNDTAPFCYLAPKIVALYKFLNSKVHNSRPPGDLAGSVSAQALRRRDMSSERGRALI